MLSTCRQGGLYIQQIPIFPRPGITHLINSDSHDVQIGISNVLALICSSIISLPGRKGLNEGHERYRRVVGGR